MPAETPAPAERAPRRHPRSLVMLICAVIGSGWLVLDQATKVVAVTLLEDPGRVVDLGFMDLAVIRNPGGAFSLPGFPGMFVVVTVVVLALVARALPRTDHLGLAAAYGLVVGGAVGNVVDRLLRAPGFPSGHVVDFFDLRWWPVFNVADVGIVTGALLVAVLMTRIERREQAAAQPPQSVAESVRPETATPRHEPRSS